MFTFAIEKDLFDEHYLQEKSYQKMSYQLKTRFVCVFVLVWKWKCIKLKLDYKIYLNVSETIKESKIYGQCGNYINIIIKIECQK